MENNIKATTLGSIHKDLFFDKKVSISFDTLEYDSSADYKVMVQIEPPTIVDFVTQILQHKNKFDLILSWHPTVLSNCKNSKLFPFGSCWINECDRGIHKKTKNLSIISSYKRQTIGHRLRHEIIENQNIDMDIFGTGYNPIDNKIIALKDYMFSIIIENDSTDNWITEKIIDCLATGTVPVYWGCSNIGDYFNIEGFIQFNNIEEFQQLIPKLNQDTYNKLLPFIKENYNLSLSYSDFWYRVTNMIEENLNDD
jgi:hypothetical protein